MAIYTQDDLRKLQSVELEMLKVIDAFCTKHDIEYFLDGGTCIGAVRHGGFIPWDDDIDLGMMREDYEKFIRLFEQDPPEGYSVHTHCNTSNYPYLFAKVYREGTKFLAQESIDAGLDSCIYIDIFAYDYVAQNINDHELKKCINKAMFWQRVMYLYYTPNPAIQPTVSFRALKKLVSKMGHYVVRCVLSPQRIASNYDKWVSCLSKGANENSPRICCVQDFGYLLGKDVLPPVPMQFEDAMFPVPHDVDAYLTMLYGDYMQLPPEEKRKTHSPEVLDFGDL